MTVIYLFVFSSKFAAFRPHFESQLFSVLKRKKELQSDLVSFMSLERSFHVTTFQRFPFPFTSIDLISSLRKQFACVLIDKDSRWNPICSDSSFWLVTTQFFS